MAFKPDYSTYSYQELVDAINSINLEAYPERYEEIKRPINGNV